MATLGLCSYCERPAGKTCTLCGKAICPHHADPQQPMVCVPCAQGGGVS